MGSQGTTDPAPRDLVPTQQVTHKPVARFTWRPGAPIREEMRTWGHRPAHPSPAPLSQEGEDLGGQWGRVTRTLAFTPRPAL